MIQLTPSQADAEFYRLVHTLLQARGSREGTERRAHERTPVWAKQRIAPIWGDKLPTRDQFQEVVCLDISVSGFAFLNQKPPDFRFVVADFGIPPHGVYVLAEVVHYRPVLLWDCGAIEPLSENVSRAGLEKQSSDWDQGNNFLRPEPMFQVGCRFIRRIEPTELPSG
jgi:hypothetical protein